MLITVNVTSRMLFATHTPGRPLYGENTGQLRPFQLIDVTSPDRLHWAGRSWPGPAPLPPRPAHLVDVARHGGNEPGLVHVTIRPPQLHKLPLGWGSQPDTVPTLQGKKAAGGEAPGTLGLGGSLAPPPPTPRLARSSVLTAGCWRRGGRWRAGPQLLRRACGRRGLGAWGPLAASSSRTDCPRPCVRRTRRCLPCRHPGQPLGPPPRSHVAPCHSR